MSMMEMKETSIRNFSTAKQILRDRYSSSASQFDLRMKLLHLCIEAYVNEFMTIFGRVVYFLNRLPEFATQPVFFSKEKSLSKVMDIVLSAYRSRNHLPLSANGSYFPTPDSEGILGYRKQAFYRRQSGGQFSAKKKQWTSIEQSSRANDRLLLFRDKAIEDRRSYVTAMARRATFENSARTYRMHRRRLRMVDRNVHSQLGKQNTEVDVVVERRTCNQTGGIDLSCHELPQCLYRVFYSSSCLSCCR